MKPIFKLILSISVQDFPIDVQTIYARNELEIDALEQMYYPLGFCIDVFKCEAPEDFSNFFFAPGLEKRIKVL
jgi:hypothetical protein